MRKADASYFHLFPLDLIAKEGNDSCPVLGESKDVGFQYSFHSSFLDAGRSPQLT